MLGKVVEGRLRGASLARLLGARAVVEHHGLRSLSRGEEALTAKLLVAALSHRWHASWRRPTGFLPASIDHVGKFSTAPAPTGMILKECRYGVTTFVWSKLSDGVEELIAISVATPTTNAGEHDCTRCVLASILHRFPCLIPGWWCRVTMHGIGKER